MKYLRFLAAIGAAIVFTGFVAGVASADQEAVNEAVVFQGGFAQSGDATGTFWAESGDAEVENESEISQKIKQELYGEGDQAAGNFAGAEQLGEAVSGDAEATDGAAETGEAEVENESEIRQRIRQFLDD